MPVTVRRIKLWRAEVPNRPGQLAKALGPLAAANADMQVVMGYRFPGNKTRAAIELYPITGKKAAAAASEAGFADSGIAALLVEGDNKPGMAYKFAHEIAAARINLDFFVGQSVGRRYSLVFGFENEDDSRKAAMLIKKTAGKK